MIQGESATRWEDIYKHLKSKGFDVYAPAQKKGECKEPYIVLKDNGLVGMVEISSNRQLYDIMCYVPESSYSLLGQYVDEVKKALDELFPMIRPTHYQTPSFLDTEAKAHMISIEYVNYQKKVRY